MWDIGRGGTAASAIVACVALSSHDLSHIHEQTECEQIRQIKGRLFVMTFAGAIIDRRLRSMRVS